MDQNYNPYEQNNGYAQQQYQQTYYVQPAAIPPEIEEYTGSAFSKALAAFILTWVPILSYTFIFSIIELSLVNKSRDLIKRVEELCAQHGAEVPGKIKAAKVFGIIARILATIVLVPWVIAFVGGIISLVVYICMIIIGGF